MPRAILEAIPTNEFRFLVLVKVPKPEKPKKRENKDKQLMMIFDITENIIPTKIPATKKARFAIFRGLDVWISSSRPSPELSLRQFILTSLGLGGFRRVPKLEKA